MKAGRWLTSLVLLAALLLVPAVTPARADDAGAFADAPAVDATTKTDTWIGALAAVGCGVMVRATIATGGTVAATYVGAVACCGYMLFDLFVVDR